jgi:hypothetical protein
MVAVDANECAKLQRARMTPPADMKTEATRWIAQLGHEKRRKREEATAELKKMGKLVVPLLKKAFHASRDPEVRARLEAIVEHFKESIEPEKTALLAPRSGKGESNVAPEVEFFDPTSQRPLPG